MVTRWPRTLHGDGQLQVGDARLTNVALVSGLNNAMNLVTRQPRHTDRMNAIFDLTPTGVEIGHLNLVTGIMAVRGAGVIGFDDSLNLILNGGPLERLQESLGLLGHALGRVTDRLVRYQVTGTTQKPVIHVRPFGFFTGDPMAEAKAQREQQRAERQEERRQRAEEAGTPAPDPGTPAPTNDATGGSGS